MCRIHGEVHAHSELGECSEQVEDFDTGDTVCGVTGFVISSSNTHCGGSYAQDYRRHSNATNVVVDHFGKTVDVRLLPPPPPPQPTQLKQQSGTEGGHGRRAVQTTAAVIRRLRSTAADTIDTLLHSNAAQLASEKRSLDAYRRACSMAVDRLNEDYAVPGGIVDIAAAVGILLGESSAIDLSIAKKNIRRLEYYVNIVAEAWAVFCPKSAATKSMVAFTIGVLYSMRKPEGLVLPLGSHMGSGTVSALPYDPYLLHLPAAMSLKDITVHCIGSDASDKIKHTAVVLDQSSVKGGRRLLLRSVKGACTTQKSTAHAAKRLMATASWVSYESAVAKYVSETNRAIART
jgi:hypothetical protein